MEVNNKKCSSLVCCLIIPVVLIVITAVIVGGVVYYWQNQLANIERQQLQQQIDSLQNQLAIIKQEKSTLNNDKFKGDLDFAVISPNINEPTNPLE